MTAEDNNNNKQRKNSETLRALAYFSQVGTTMVASVLIGVLLGRFLDGIFNTTPWLLLIFSMFGVGAAIKVIFNISRD